ncbi:MAG: nitronate monooxygenase [Alphaproteobacteria bacterium]|nr:nitronate monooxygenase [Alphaproteobacteria bacterium]
MKALNPILMSGVEVLPLVEGGKGISATNGESSGAWAACGGIGTFSGVNADSYDEAGNIIPQLYNGRTRKARHEELVQYAIEGAVAQARIAHEMANGLGRIHVNILWEMGGAQRVLQGVLDGAKGLIHGVTCGAGMPYRLAEIAAGYGIYYYPIVSSGRAFRALWKRAYHKFAEFMGAVVYEDPWRAGGHNGLSNSEDPHTPEPPYPRVVALREQMREFGLDDVPIVMAGGVWYLREWEDWIDNPELGPISFQFGTRALLTKESPIPEAWKQRLLSLKEGGVLLNRFSPTGFWSSAVRNDFIDELEQRNARQIAFTEEPLGEHSVPFPTGVRKREVYVTEADRRNAEGWIGEGFTEALRTPASTLIFVTTEKMNQIRKDQSDCMGCLSQCLFSNWAEADGHSSGRKADPRSYCIQKTLQDVVHSERTDTNLMFAGHGAYRFAKDPFYSNGFIPTVRELFERIVSGD